jgi:hypothetical protein
MNFFKSTLGIILSLVVLIGGWFLVTWAISSWSNYHDEQNLNRCISVVGSEINNDTKTESICSKLYPSINE